MQRIRTARDAWPWLAILGLAGIIAGLAGLVVGPGLDPRRILEWSQDPTARIIVGELRIPRVLCGYLVGAALASSGAVVQSLLRNPLAGPEVLGLSAGAGAGALTAASFTGGLWGALIPSLGAWIGATGAALVIITLATNRRGTSLTGVVLAGMALSSLLSGITTMLLTVHRETDISRYLFWLVGSLENRRWVQVFLVLGPVVASLGLFIALSGRLNILAMGDDVARTLGVRPQPLKVVFLGAVALATGASVAVAGAIGFIGLLVPHAVRLLWGQDSRWFIPLSALAGGFFLVLADVVVRLIFSPFEVPVGIFTALLGAPFFLALLVREQRRGAV